MYRYHVSLSKKKIFSIDDDHYALGFNPMFFFQTKNNQKTEMNPVNLAKKNKKRYRQRIKSLNKIIVKTIYLF